MVPTSTAREVRESITNPGICSAPTLGVECRREVYGDAKSCIFHIEKTDDRQTAIFIQLLKGEVEKMLGISEDRLDLRGFVFPPGVDLREIFGSQITRELTFRGAKFHDVIFEKIVFQGEVDFTFCTFIGPAEFSRCTFNRDALFMESKFASSLSVKGSRFYGRLDFSQARFQDRFSFSNSHVDYFALFSESVMQGSVSFRDSTFKKGGDYSLVRFEGSVRFLNMRFSEDTAFFDARFLKQANFGSTSFDQVSFDHAQFNEGVKFFAATFGKLAEFNGTIFKSNVDFAGARFEGDLYFLDSECEGRIGLNQVRFDSLCDFSKSSFESSNFSESVFAGEVRFYDVTFAGPSSKEPVNFRDVRFISPELVEFRGTNESPIDLSNISFLSTNVEEVTFVDEKWRSVGSRKVVIDEGLISQTDATYEKVKQLYRRLRKNYESNRRYADAGDFFVGEMEMRRLDVANNRRFLRVLWQNLSLIALYKWLSVYGESPSRLFYWSAGIILFFSLLRYLIIPEESLTNVLEIYIIHLGQSTSAFFQFPISKPIVDIPQRIASAFILALLAISLRRKFERR